MSTTNESTVSKGPRESERTPGDGKQSLSTKDSTAGAQTDAAPATAVPTEGAVQNVNLTGRAVFAVETTAAGVVVRTAFLTEEQRLLDMPAVFPDVMYAMNVIDELKAQVMQHFSQAAQVGAQVIANQARAQQEQQQGQQQGQQQAGASDAPKA